MLLIHLTYYLECISSHNLEVYHIFYGSVLRYTYHKEFQLAIKFRLEYFCGIKYLNVWWSLALADPKLYSEKTLPLKLRMFYSVISLDFLGIVAISSSQTFLIMFII